MPRYVLHPGWIYSKNDRQRQFISGSRLASLYKVSLRDCVYGHRYEYKELPGDVHLHPRLNGDYTLPESNEE